MKSLISIFLAFSSLSLIAQNNLITFEYDAAGNRVKRHADQFCEQEKTHNEPFTITHQFYKAADNIESTILVDGNDTLIYKAGEYILLKNGFEVVSDAKFDALIEQCDPE